MRSRSCAPCAASRCARWRSTTLRDSRCGEVRRRHLGARGAEPEAEEFHRWLLEHEPVMSCGTLIETFRVMQVGLGAPALADLDRLLALCEVEPMPVDHAQVGLARAGMLAYGKGRAAEPAGLNFGDLFAYALAKRLGLSLLFKGEGFAKTDVASLT